MREYGFCYVADCDAYIDEAMRSIASLREHMPSAPVAFVTHRHLFRPDAPVTDWVELEQGRKGPIVKVDSRLAPYERVGFLDTDTLITAELTELFALLDRFDFAYVPEPNARPERGSREGVPDPFPEPNSGFFLFRKTPDVLAFFDAWLGEYDALHEAQGVSADQPSLRIALWKSKALRHLMLGAEYNLIPHASCSISGTVALVHDRSPERFQLARTVNRKIGPRAVVQGLGPIFGFAGRRAWIGQYLRLCWNFLRVMFRPALIRQQGHPVVWWRDDVD